MADKRAYTSRLAPTPNGEIHWGNLMNFALTWALVRRSGGKLWLRFDDIDQARCQEKYAESTREVLRHLGLHWDEEYSHQSRHIESYRAFLSKLPHYVCDCSRQDVLKRTGASHYDGHCRNRGLEYRAQQSSIRFLSPRGPAEDFVLWRREDIPAYHLTCLYDDIRMGVDLIVRGEDLLESTMVQKQLSKTLPDDPYGKAAFIHHPLLTTPDGEKLSKSRGDGELMTLIHRGARAEEIYEELSRRMGLEAPPKKAGDLFAVLDRLHPEAAKM